MCHAVLRADSHGAGAPGETLLAHACLVFANAAVVAPWVASLLVAKFSSPLRVALARVGVVSSSDASTMVVAVLFAPPVFHIARISCVTCFTLARATVLAQPVPGALLWASLDVAAGTCPARDASALSRDHTLALSRAPVGTPFLAVQTAVSSVAFHAFWLPIRIGSATSVPIAPVLARVFT